MYLQDDKIVITLNSDVVLRSYNTGSGRQFLLDETALTGWSDGVDVKRSASVRQTSAGDFMEVGYNSSRHITAQGYAIAKDATELRAMRDDLIGAFPPEIYQTLKIQDSTGTRTIVASSGGKPSWIQLTDNYATFNISFYAPDPYIYNYTTTTMTLEGVNTKGGLNFPLDYELDYASGSGYQDKFVSNKGNAPAWPKFKVHGDFPEGFSITDNLGNFITYTGGVSFGAPVTIDSRTGTVKQSNSDRSTYLSSREWFAIPPQGSLQASFLPVYSTASGWCDIIYRDTWI
jgi:hypothetical protein